MDRLQPKLLFPSAGKASARPGSHAGRVFAVKKSDIIPTCRPTLDMAMERQTAAGYKGAKSAVSHPLLERINRAGWSDDEDEEEYHCQGDLHCDGEGTSGERGIEIREGDSRSDELDTDEEDMVVEDDNPFMQPSDNQASASFLHRLQQVQVNSSGQSRSGAVRAVHGAHRYNPYSQQQSQPRNHARVQALTHAHYAPPPAYARH